MLRQHAGRWTEEFVHENLANKRRVVAASLSKPKTVARPTLRGNSI